MKDRGSLNKKITGVFALYLEFGNEFQILSIQKTGFDLICS